MSTSWMSNMLHSLFSHQIGVHSAKFDNEKDSENISAALKRYDITHPVVNDCEGELWSKLGISCWPTVLVLGKLLLQPFKIPFRHAFTCSDIGLDCFFCLAFWLECFCFFSLSLFPLGPDGEPLFKLIGEFNPDHLVNFVRSIVAYFGSHGKLSSHPLPLSPSASVLKGPLLFPGKVTCTTQPDGTELIAVANSGLHTIIITSADGMIKVSEFLFLIFFLIEWLNIPALIQLWFLSLQFVIGNSGKPGFADGDFSNTLFNSPQGLAFANFDVLYVADTDNHAIRKASEHSSFNLDHFSSLYIDFNS